MLKVNVSEKIKLFEEYCGCGENVWEISQIFSHVELNLFVTNFLNEIYLLNVSSFLF